MKKIFTFFIGVVLLFSSFHYVGAETVNPSSSASMLTELLDTLQRALQRIDGIDQKVDSVVNTVQSTDDINNVTSPDTNNVTSPDINSPQIIFPKAGEQLVLGETYIIKWNRDQSEEYVTLSLIKSNSPTDRKIIISMKADNDGDFRYKPTNLLPADTYQIMLYGYKSKALLAQSQQFSIVNQIVPPPSEADKIISPKAGDQWMLGETYLIKWNKNQSEEYVTLSLIKSNSPTDRKIIISMKADNDGDFRYKPTNLLPADTYQIMLYGYKSKALLAQSQQFSIVNQIVPPSSRGSLQVTKDVAMSDVKYSPGLVNAKLGQFVIQANDLIGGIKLSKIKVNFQETKTNISPEKTMGLIRNLRLVDPINGKIMSNIISRPTSQNNIFDVDTSIGLGLKKKISIHGDIAELVSGEKTFISQIPQDGITARTAPGNPIFAPSVSLPLQVFTIASNSGAVSLLPRVISPNGGEIINIKEQPLKIIFSPKAGVRHDIVLINQMTGENYNLSNLIPSGVIGSPKSFQEIIVWIPLEKVTNGVKFRLEICADSICDSSDGDFSLVKNSSQSNFTNSDSSKIFESRSDSELTSNNNSSNDIFKLESIVQELQKLLDAARNR